jgi:hypothetical protein
MITKFYQFINEVVSAKDYRNVIDFRMETGDKTPQQMKNEKPTEVDRSINKNSQTKITDISNRVQQLNKEKQMVSQEIIKLEDSQRELMPNNPQDPQNAQKQKQFTDDMKTKIGIQRQKLDVLNKEIVNLQQDVSTKKQKYM